MDRRCALGGVAGAALVGCFNGDTTGDDANTDAAPEAADETSVDCSGTAGILVGAETDFPVGTWTMVNSTSFNPYIVAQDSNGFYAFTAICTHQGCIVDAPDSTGVTICPCHGSEFDGNGKVIFGPAVLPLAHYAVNICGGMVYVDGSTRVNAATRTPPQ